MTSHGHASNTMEPPVAALLSGRDTPSDSQREAIEAPAGAVLVRAGPGAGKTFCLIERIRFLIERVAIAPERLCAFTFTNKAAGEIATRLARTLPNQATLVKTGTIHAFCAELLRELGSHVGLEPGFGIADENYQRAVLGRLGANPRWMGILLSRFANHRLRGDPLDPRDEPFFKRYDAFLAHRRVLDFDMLLLKGAALLADEAVAADLRARWDCILLDEFQDLNPAQYSIIRSLALSHGNIFAVGDDEQSIYSWTGADPEVFRDFVRDFDGATIVHVRDNRRCPRQVLEPARQLVEMNTPIFTDRQAPAQGHESQFPVDALTFSSEETELAWVIADVRRDREAHDLAWGDIALLYRTHQIGQVAEAALVAEQVPCLLALGKAFADDPIVAYVIAALRVIAAREEIHEEQFLSVVLPRAIIDEARAEAGRNACTLLEQITWMGSTLGRGDEDGRKIRRGLSSLSNLGALGRRHSMLASLVEELLSQRVGTYSSVLEANHDEITDPIEHPHVVRLAERLGAALRDNRPVWVARLGGAEIPLKGVLHELSVRTIVLGGPKPVGAVCIHGDDGGTLGVPLALFKAAQLIRSRGFTSTFRDFTAVDLETTGRDVTTAEIVEIAAVRVRDGKVVDQYHSLVRPRVPIEPDAQKKHTISEEQLAGEPYFENVWPAFRDFAGRDVLIAHNGYEFDFPILSRMAATLPGWEPLCTYDSLPMARELHSGSARLEDLARHFRVPMHTAHRALGDTRMLAGVFLALRDMKLARARKTALTNLLDYLGLALALSADTPEHPEAARLMELTKAYALGRYSECLDMYGGERESAEDDSLPTVAEVIEKLGGEEAMQRIRAERGADARYPLAMARLRRLLDHCGEGSLAEQIALFLERVALSSRGDGVSPERDRVNLLTLHSTKGLEFSRVYVLGVEDRQLPGGSLTRPPEAKDVEEARRLLYVGMTRAKDRLVMTRVESRGGRATGGHRFLDEMGIVPSEPA